MGCKILMTLNGLDIGGAETHVFELVRELRRRGYEIVLASSGGSYAVQMEAEGIRHYTIPMNSRSVSAMSRSLKLLRQLIKEEKPDLIHAHARIPGFLCGMLHKKYGIPFVTTAHWVFYTNFLLNRITNWGQRTVAVSEDIKTYLMDNYNVPADHIYVTINGIDTDSFSPDVSGLETRRALGIPEDAPVICLVSRLDESRALAARKLIAVSSRLAQAIPGVRVLVVGGGDVYEELAQAAEQANGEAGYPCVVMTGPRTDINLLVAAGDVFVGVSRAALEAMSASKPTILAGNEGYIGTFTPEKLEAARGNNFCCRGFELPEEEILLKDLLELMNAAPEEKKRLGDYGRQVILEEYSVSRMADDCEKAYRDVL